MIPAPDNLVAVFTRPDKEDLKRTVIGFDDKGWALIIDFSDGRAVPASSMTGFAHLEYR
jgi:hypothetical protein